MNTCWTISLWTTLIWQISFSCDIFSIVLWAPGDQLDMAFGNALFIQISLYTFQERGHVLAVTSFGD